MTSENLNPTDFFKDSKSKKFGYSMPREQGEYFKNIADELGISASAIVAHLILGWLNDNGHLEPAKLKRHEILNAIELAIEVYGEDKVETAIKSLLEAA